jgi:hypothetical protein
MTNHFRGITLTELLVILLIVDIGSSDIPRMSCAIDSSRRLLEPALRTIADLHPLTPEALSASPLNAALRPPPSHRGAVWNLGLSGLLLFRLRHGHCDLTAFTDRHTAPPTAATAPNSTTSSPVAAPARLTSRPPSRGRAGHVHAENRTRPARTGGIDDDPVALLRWAKAQLRASAAGTLGPHRAAQLAAAGLTLQLASDQYWDGRLAALRRVIRAGGPPPATGSLGRWLRRQQRAAAAGRLDAQRVRQLRAAGADLATRAGDRAWDDRLQDLMLFRQVHRRFKINVDLVFNDINDNNATLNCARRLLD